MNSPLILALDIGTSSVRASVYDRECNLFDGITIKIEYSMKLTPDGGVEIDANEMVSMVEQAIDKAMESLADRAGDLIAVAASTFWHSLLGIDQQNRAITPIISWNDTRSRTAAATLRASLNEAKLHSRTGCRIHAAYWPA